MDRNVPFDQQAERATLGAILLDREAIIAVAALLTPAQFYLEKHGWVYEAALACYNRRVPPDIATLADELRCRERLEPIGGIAFLGELVAEVPTAVHVEYYAEIVARTATRRRLIETGGKIAALGYAEQDDLETTLDQADSALFQVTQQHGGGAFVSASVVLRRYFAEAQRFDDTVVATGFPDLDRLCNGGFRPGNLVLLAARPGVGKSGLALSILLHAAAAGQTVGLVSKEMSETEVVDRLLAQTTGINSQHVQQRLRQGDARVTEAMGRLDRLSWWLDDAADASILQVRAKARRQASTTGLQLLIVDYLQLLLGDHKPGQTNRTDEVSRVSRQLKLLAKELACPILALSQMSREIEKRTTKVPQLSDLRDSGSLEQDADVVLFIHREELYDRATEQQGIAEIHVAKNRHGPLGIVPLRFVATTTEFHNLERYRAPEGY